MAAISGWVDWWGWADRDFAKSRNAAIPEKNSVMSIANRQIVYTCSCRWAYFEMSTLYHPGSNLGRFKIFFRTFLPKIIKFEQCLNKPAWCLASDGLAWTGIVQFVYKTTTLNDYNTLEAKLSINQSVNNTFKLLSKIDESIRLSLSHVIRN